MQPQAKNTRGKPREADEIASGNFTVNCSRRKTGFAGHAHDCHRDYADMLNILNSQLL